MKKIVAVIIVCSLSVPGWVSAQGTINNCHCWIPLDSTFQIVPMTEGPDKGTFPLYQNDNAATPSVSLPFNFCFYGQNYDSVFICNNGIITFAYPVYEFITAGGFPLGQDSLIIAPFFADSYTRFTTGVVYYKITPTYMVVRWDYVGFETLDQDFYNTFQLIITDGNDPILPAGNNVQYCYIDMQWASADNSGGFDGFGGIPAIIGVNKGNGADYAQMATFNVPGMVYYGPFAAFNGLQWLFNKSFLFNTCVSGNTLAPIILNEEDNCNTIPVCASDTLTITSSFICAQPGQTETLSASYSGVSNFSIVSTSITNVIDSITVRLITTTADTGTHVLTITATDNSAPAQVASLPFTIVINNCVTGINEQAPGNEFSIYPNPGNGVFTIETNSQGGSKNYKAKIDDILGNEIYASSLNGLKTEINISSSPDGVYFLKLSDENGLVLVKKIVLK